MKVVDFGIARIESSGSDKTVGRMLGTPIYMSPERMLGQSYDGRVDVYGVGVCLYEALSGTLPFDLPEDLPGIVMACVSQPVRPLHRVVDGVPRGLEALVVRTLSKRPETRPTMQELLVALPAALDGHADPEWSRTLENPQ